MNGLENTTTSRNERPYRRFRPFAIVLEGIPATLFIAGLLVGPTQLLIVGTVCLAPIYILGGWYLFKRQRFQVWDILIATLSGFLLFVVLTGILFYLANWEYGMEMLTMSSFTLNGSVLLAILLVAVRWTTGKHKEQEFTMSFKILSRFVILFVLFYSLGLNAIVEEKLQEVELQETVSE